MGGDVGLWGSCCVHADTDPEDQILTITSMLMLIG